METRKHIGKRVGMMVLGSLAALGVHAEITSEDFIEYAIAGDGEVYVTGIKEGMVEKDGETAYFPPSRRLDIPETVTIGDETYTVTAIGDRALWGNPDFVEVTVPNTVRVIGREAFAEMMRLERVNFAPESTLETIWVGAFNGTALEEFELPKSVTSIGVDGSGVRVGTIFGTDDGGGWSTREYLRSLTVEDGNPVYSAGDNCIIETAAGVLVEGSHRTNSIPIGVEEIATEAFAGWGGGYIDLYRVRIIRARAFAASSVPPDGRIYAPYLEIIEENAFEGWTSETLSIELRFGDVPTNTGNQNVTYWIEAGERANYVARWGEGYTFKQSNIEVHWVINYPIEYETHLTYEESGNRYEMRSGYILTLDHDEGERTLTVTAEIPEGYMFDHWEDGDTSPSKEFTFKEDVVIPLWVLKVCEVSADVSDPAAGTVIGAGTYYEGGTIDLYFEANEGYEFLYWIDDDDPYNEDMTTTDLVSSRVYEVDEMTPATKHFTAVVRATGTDGVGSVRGIEGIRLDGNTLVVKGHEGETMSIGTTLGQVVYEGKAQSISLEKGIYGVRIGTERMKIMVP